MLHAISLSILMMFSKWHSNVTQTLPQVELCVIEIMNGFMWKLYLFNKQFLGCRFVVIAMEAMDQLLVACHAQTLNLFVESFLKMVQKLLESADPQLQILATQSVC